MKKGPNNLDMEVTDKEAKVIIEVTPTVRKIFEQELDCALEMLKGLTELLPNDMTRHTFTVTDPDKIAVLRHFGTLIIFDPEPPQLN